MLVSTVKCVFRRLRRELATNLARKVWSYKDVEEALNRAEEKILEYIS